MTPNRAFLIKFCLILAVGFLVLTAGPVDRSVVTPMTALLARVTAAGLGLLGEKVVVTGTLISSPLFAVQILNGCNGVEAILILVASICAFPATVRSRMIGVLVGCFLIQTLNIVRLISLFLLGAYHRNLFDLFHSAVWQVLIILASLAIFVLWTRYSGKRASE